MANSLGATKSQNPAVGYILLAVGILCLLVGGFNVAPAVQSGSDPRGWAAVLCFVGVIVAIFGSIQIYDSRPLPNEPIHAPPPLQLVQDESWRKHSGLRYLEALKDELTSQEEGLISQYDRAKQAYEKLPHSSGRIEYNRWRQQKSYAEAAMPSAQKEITALKQRIEMIVGGNVEPELLTLKQTIKKFERSNQENQRTLLELDKPCNIKHDAEQCAHDRAKQRAHIREYIHQNDNRLIELQTHQEELKNYDFRNLWKGLGHSAAAGAGLSAVGKDQLQDMKDKADILRAIQPLSPAAPKPSPEEERRKKEAQAETRLKRHEQNRKDALERILQGKRFEELPSDDQDEYKREENSWAEMVRQDRDDLRKLQR